MESRWLAFDRLVRDVGALKDLHDSSPAVQAPLLAQARLATQEALAAVQRAAEFTATDFDDHLFAQAAAAVTRAQRATALACAGPIGRPSPPGTSPSAG